MAVVSSHISRNFMFVHV